MKKVSLITIIGVLLLLNGIINIFDDGRVLVYDITSILAGMGFIVLDYRGK